MKQLYDIVQYNTTFSTVQYSIVQYSIVQYNTIQYKAVQYNAVQRSTIQNSTGQYNTVQYTLLAPLTTICSGVYFVPFLFIKSFAIACLRYPSPLTAVYLVNPLWAARP